MSVLKFAKSKQMSPATLGKWQRKARTQLENVSFAKVRTANLAPAQLELHVHGATLVVHRGFDATLLREVVSALRPGA